MKLFEITLHAATGRILRILPSTDESGTFHFTIKNKGESSVVVELRDPSNTVLDSTTLGPNSSGILSATTDEHMELVISSGTSTVVVRCGASQPFEFRTPVFSDTHLPEFGEHAFLNSSSSSSSSS